MLRIFRGGLLTALATLAVSGCREPESIQSYETPAGERRPRLDADAARASLDHMFAAVVPDGKKAWFFKLVAPAKAAEALRRPFDDFVASIELQKNGKTPTWKLADGWKEQPGDEMRAATIEIPQDGGEPLELTVSSLPFEEEWSPYLERNVNRWMDQLQQGPLKRKVIEEIARPMKIQNGDATVFELVGVMDRRGMMPPGHPPVAGISKGPAPAATAPVASAPSGGQSSELTYDAPPHWEAGPASAMRKASFVVSGNDARAEVAVTAFPAAPMMADPLANAKRWAGEVGVGGTDAELEALITEIKVDNLAGQYMEFVPPAEGERPQATLAAMVKRGDQMWFFKLKGDRAVVDGQRDAFRKFLESVRFAAK